MAKAKKADAKKDAKKEAKQEEAQPTNWFHRGAAGVAEIQKNAELGKARKEKYALDFFMSENDKEKFPLSARIIFLEDAKDFFLANGKLA